MVIEFVWTWFPLEFNILFLHCHHLLIPITGEPLHNSISITEIPTNLFKNCLIIKQMEVDISKIFPIFCVEIKDIFRKCHTLNFIINLRNLTKLLWMLILLLFMERSQVCGTYNLMRVYLWAEYFIFLFAKKCSMPINLQMLYLDRIFLAWVHRCDDLDNFFYLVTFEVAKCDTHEHSSFY